MSETLIVTFQSQLAGIMETILKSAVYEITRLVEDNFLQEVDRGKQEVEMLRLKLQLSEIKLKEKEWERRKRVRCVDCGRAGVVEGEETCNSQQIDADILGNNEEKESMDKEWCSTLKQENKNAEDPVCARDQASKLNHNIGVSCTFASKRTLQSPTLTGSAPSLNDGSHFQQCGSDADELSSSPAAPSTRQVSCITSGSISDSRCPVTYPDVPSESTAIACHVKEEAEATPVWSSKHIETDFRHDWPPERGSRGPSENSDSQVEIINRFPLHTSQETSTYPISCSVKLDTAKGEIREMQTKPPSISPGLSQGCSLQVHYQGELPVPGSNLSVYGNSPLPSQDDPGPKPFRCARCPKSFSQYKHLRVHQKLHTQRSHPCIHCGRTFLHLCHLKAHMLTHVGKKPLNCPQCDKAFVYNFELKLHLRQHSGEKPYVCTHCGKCFARQSNFKQHQNIHTQEKMFSCAYCGMRFTRSSNLRVHLKRHGA